MGADSDNGLSVAIITKNEEKHLPRALESVKFADEIIIIDSGSTDGTLEIARAFTDKVIQHDWLGYGAQKNFALDQTTRAWVLSLDADEELSPELGGEVQDVVQERVTGFDLYSMPRLSLFVDRWMRHGGWYPDRQVRLLRNGVGRFAERKVHESIVSDRPVGRLSGDILHYSFDSIEDYVDRMNRYSTLGAEMLVESGRVSRINAVSVGLTIARKFLEVYVLKRGFLDGRHGLIVSWLAAYQVFLRAAKTWKRAPSTGGPTSGVCL